MSQLLEHINQEKLSEMALVDIAFEILKETKRPHNFRELMEEIAKLRNLSQDQMMNVIAQVYTEVNIDGRFTCIGENVWGLKRWYPTETVEENIEGGGKRKKVAVEDDFDDDFEIEDELVEEYEDEDEITVFEEDEDFIDSEDEIEDEIVEDEEIFEDEEIEEEEEVEEEEVEEEENDDF